MGGEQGKPGGPDLSAGVPFADLADGKPLVGHAGDDAVLLVRQGQEVFAVGATCTHYSGPLGEGLIQGDSVRCPWHHACFSLRTGAAERAPALNPIACYDVERSGDRVRVGARRAAPAAPAPSPSAPGAVVIIGAGAAGHAAAEMLRREGHQGSITLVGADADAPYDRPNLSKDYLAGTAPEEWMPLRPPEFYGEHRIDLKVGTRATAVDTGARSATLADGRRLTWEALLLATGAEPIALTVPGADRAQVHTLRSLADSRAIIARATGARRAVVVGASFIALEAAAALRARKIEVDVVAPETTPFERLLGPELGDFLRGLHEQHGVTFHLGQTVQSIGEQDVQLSGGARLPADLVLAGIGVKPALALAEAAGLAVDRGIKVDEFLQTSVPGVYAAGDAARYPDPISGQDVRIEHWTVAQRMGQTAARNILGQRRRFHPAPFFWTVHYDVTLNYVGHAERWDRIEIHGTLADRDCTVAYRVGERTLAVATIGRDSVSLAAELAFERGDQAALRAFGRDR
ncbi:MAG TPA: FAD-dependent oxidoreductase [Polyangia bacterium]|jgi:NADPH-dependent 2,4-dienoyl-CoA reductase/sulfur reductase-like enzyme/nitrite reductase/ring-hydroxylating ferredoxin subunit|nr:FAD-dependent oxidoreductase [Polyangia bacterium]